MLKLTGKEAGRLSLKSQQGGHQKRKSTKLKNSTTGKIRIGKTILVFFYTEKLTTT